MKTDDSRTVETALLDVIRVETALSKFPMHRLAKQGTVPIEIREADANGELAVRWEVSHNSKYGQPGPLAYRVDTMVVNRRVEQAGRPTPRALRLGSLKEIARELDLGGDTQKVKTALRQNAGVFISAKISYRSVDGTERRLEVDGTRYVVVLSGERLPDGRTADAVYLVLNDFYREVLDRALRRPLDFDYLRDLPPIAQRWYELASYRMFAALKHHWPKVRLSYAEFCAHAPQARHMGFGLMRRQMEKVHAPHRRSGYIAGVEIEATTDREGRPDWTMLYAPGPKAKAEYQASTKKGSLVVLETEPVKPEPGPEPTGLERELVDRGVSRGVAAELVRDFPEDRIAAQIEHVDRTRRKIRDKAAFLVSAIRADFAVKAEPAKSPDERSLQARDRDRAERLRMRKFWEGLSPAEREAFDREALAHADPEQRAEYDRQDDPRLRRLHLTPIRDAHIRARLAAG